MDNPIKVISLFAGAGGCSLGFKNAGAEIISAYDNDSAAVETYNKNFGHGKCEKIDLSSCNFLDLREKLGLHKGDLDLIIGGPPCQGFTTAGNRFWDDPRNKLVQNYAQALEIFFPRWFMMENVEGILTTANGTYLIECIKKMISLGYTVSLKKVYMQEYGVPQRRKRVIIVGNREGKHFDFPAPLVVANGMIYRLGSSTLRDAIQDLESHEQLDIDHKFKTETGLQLERICSLKCGQTMKNLPEHLQHPSFKKRASRRVCDGTPSEKRGGSPSGLKRLFYDEPSLTITSASISEFVHPTQNRTLTIRECARIQTFPDSFVFCGTDSQKILQVGNAIPPRFAEIIARQIISTDLSATPNSCFPGLNEYEITKATAMSPALSKTNKMLQQLQYQQLQMEVF